MDYSFWRGSLSGEQIELTVGRAEPGFYRHQGQPVAIWPGANGELVAKVGTGRAVAADAGWCERVFAWCARHPVTEQAYRDAVEGKPWHDEDATVKVIAGIGHNSGDEAEAARDQVAAATRGAAEYTAIPDDATAARAQSLRARIMEIAADIKTRHKAEKQPHLEAGRGVDAKWLPLVKDAEAAASFIRAALSAFETGKDRANKAAAQKAEQERINAARNPGAGAPPSPEPVAPEKPARVRGGYGRAASVRTVRIAVIADQDAVYRTFRDNAEVKALLQKLAQRAITNAPDVAIPGVKIEEQKAVI